MNPWRGLGALPKEVWYLCLAILVNRAGTMVLPFLTLYLTVDRQWSAGTAGLALTIYGIAAIIVAPLAGRLSDRIGGLLIIKLSLFLSGLILFVFPFVTSYLRHPLDHGHLGLCQRILPPAKHGPDWTTYRAGTTKNGFCP